MKNQFKSSRLWIVSILALLTFTSCNTDWIGKAIGFVTPIISNLFKARGDETATVTKIDTPAFATTRDDISAEQQQFFQKSKTIQYLAVPEIDATTRGEIKAKIDEYSGKHGIQTLYASGNNYVLGRLEGSDVHDVLIVKDDGSAAVIFGLEGIFSKSLIESLSKSGEIFNTLNYLESNK
jgi:hypothetical protein